MSSDFDGPDFLVDLRRRAEERMRLETAELSDKPPEHLRVLIHELRTHRIELELQNEELRWTQDELIQSRDCLADLYDFAPVGYATVNAKGMILEANLTLADLVRIDRRQLVGRALSSFVHPEDQDSYYLHRRQAQATAGGDTCELRLNISDSGPIWVGLRSRPTDVTGEPEGCIRTAISDITGRKLAELEATLLEQKLLQAQKLEGLGLMAGGVAHDFNNLLMTILGNCELALADLATDSPGRKNLIEIRTAARHAASLSGQMLTYTGTRVHRSAEVDVGSVMAELVGLLAVTTPAHIEMELDLAADLPTVDGDPIQIRQVIMNLITNAAESIGGDGGTVSLSARVMDCDQDYLDALGDALQGNVGDGLAAGRYVCLEVADTGSGVVRENLGKIFDPFFTTKTLGRGLGLSSVLGIVRSHRGTLAIETAPDAGTRFRVLLPARAQADGAAD